MAYNPLTLAYDSSIQGEILKKRDEETKVNNYYNQYRALLRAQNIDKHYNSQYNILTGIMVIILGSDRQAIKLSEKPHNFIEKNQLSVDYSIHFLLRIRLYFI